MPIEMHWKGTPQRAWTMAALVTASPRIMGETGQAPRNTKGLSRKLSSPPATTEAIRKASSTSSPLMPETQIGFVVFRECGFESVKSGRFRRDITRRHGPSRDIDLIKRVSRATSS